MLEEIEWIQISRKYISYKQTSIESPITLRQRNIKNSKQKRPSRSHQNDIQYNHTNHQSRGIKTSNPSLTSYQPKGFYNKLKLESPSQITSDNPSLNSIQNKKEPCPTFDQNLEQLIKGTAINLNSELNKFATNHPNLAITPSGNNNQDVFCPKSFKQLPNYPNPRSLYPDPINIENFVKEIPLTLQIGPNFAQVIQELNTLNWVSRCLFPPKESPTTRRDEEGIWYVTSYYHAKYLYTNDMNNLPPVLFEFHPSIDCITYNDSQYRIWGPFLLPTKIKKVFQITDKIATKYLKFGLSDKAVKQIMEEYADPTDGAVYARSINEVLRSNASCV